MARSKSKNRRNLTAWLAVIAACLIIGASVAVQHQRFLTAFGLTAWAFVPLTLLLAFTWPTRCRVTTTKAKPCKNESYGFLFGCTGHGHKLAKFFACLGFQKDATQQVQRSKPANAQALMYTPARESEPIKVTVEDGFRGVCAFWLSVIATIATIVQLLAASWSIRTQTPSLVSREETAGTLKLTFRRRCSASPWRTGRLAGRTPAGERCPG